MIRIVIVATVVAVAAAQCEYHFIGATYQFDIDIDFLLNQFLDI